MTYLDDKISRKVVLKGIVVIKVVVLDVRIVVRSSVGGVVAYLFLSLVGGQGTVSLYWFLLLFNYSYA